MIVKMKFITITGPRASIDRVTDEYLAKYEVQLENALSELKTVKDLGPYVEVNPYKDLMKKSEEYLSLIDTKNLQPDPSMSLDEAQKVIYDIDEKITDLQARRNAASENWKNLHTSLDLIEPFRELTYNVHQLLNFRFVKYRFGKISQEYFHKFEKYVYESLDTIFYKCHVDQDYVWGVYFVPAKIKEKVDAVYSSLHFERLYLPDDYQGTPEEAYQDILRKIADCEKEVVDINEQISAELNKSRQELVSAANKIAHVSKNFDIRKLAACTSEKGQVFFILCGWMSEKDAYDFIKDVEKDEELFVLIEDDHNETFSKPPTKLKNPKVFRPFEMFIKMYGLPVYDEFDPTVFLAITYTFIFGCMFGDAGQGILLVIGGFLLYKFKKSNLAAIIGTAGIFSTIFGVLYGSFFGFEDVIPALWLKPMEQVITLPIVGTLNTVLVLAVAFGMAMILIAMLINIYNGIKQHNVGKIFFDSNGLSGFIFYGALVLTVVLLMTGNTLPAAILLIVMFVLPLVLILFKEPLTALVTRHAELMPKEKGMFLVQSFFELFEVVLSYLTNTISFVRIGAFALSHAGMMQVVLMLANAENGGSPNWPVVVIGNLFVMGMEGLIVGIHVLRLEYYEMFSRFFSGSGREFVPYTEVKSKK
ncbi:V-type ATP synthase subunit I [Diplocloster agilis]|uniref:ATPase n=1 Tax=Diplocloster agilis TaxID=2850323 RepID=A0A949K2L0_9FIRM|nr:V-type ATPase 116kDa subunit family protein [Suonthocola fibrivorans]MBU9739049.1 ATPase [Diplocloster agilis]MBU9742584.1 ATPase [Diplocloster agilis]MCU6735810.1 ATPase [Suonthocola fibrivorans]SCJ82243.1 V-type ATP synthase subunit I [uncultured Clostridium sp.]